MNRRTLHAIDQFVVNGLAKLYNGEIRCLRDELCKLAVFCPTLATLLLLAERIEICSEPNVAKLTIYKGQMAVTLRRFREFLVEDPDQEIFVDASTDKHAEALIESMNANFYAFKREENK